MPTPIDHAMTVGLKAVGLLIGCFVLTLIGLFVLGIVTTFAMHS